MGIYSGLPDLMLGHGISHGHHRIMTAGGFSSFGEKVLMIQTWSIPGSSHDAIHDAIFGSTCNGILGTEFTFAQNPHGSSSLELLKIRLAFSPPGSNTIPQAIIASDFGMMHTTKRTAHQTADTPFCFGQGKLRNAIGDAETTAKYIVLGLGLRTISLSPCTVQSIATGRRTKKWNFTNGVFRWWGSI